MIFTFDGKDYGHDKIFHGRDIDIDEWTSKIPGMDFFKATSYDDKLLDLVKGSDMYGGISYVAQTAFYNVVTATRIVIGQLAQTVGFLQTDFINISKSFQQEAGDLAFKIFNTANAILDSDLFQRGMDALGAIPIVGWILKIIVKIAEMIYRLYDNIIKKKISQTDIELWNQPWIPVAQFSKEADQELTKYTLDKIRNYDVNFCFSPRNYWEDIADFLVRREKKGEQEKFTDFYNISSLRNSPEGAGFIPGTMTLSSHLRLPTKAGSIHYGLSAQIIDTGDYYPTVRNLCNQLYQVVQKIGPSLYTITPDHLSTLWENNIHSLLEYCEESIKKGWAWYPTACIKEMDDEDCKTEDPYFLCSKEMAESGYDSQYSVNHPQCNKKSHIGNKIKINQKDNYYNLFRQYLANTYFDGQFKDKNGKPINNLLGDLTKVDPFQSVPSKALKVIKERQQAGLDSLYCAYIAPDERFPGLDNNLKNKLTKNFQIILESNEWKNLRWRDIVDKDFKAAVAEKAKKAKLQYDKDGPITNPLHNKKMKSLLGDPEPPKAFDPVKPKRIGRDDIVKKPISTTSSSILPLAGAGMMAYFLLK